MACEELTAWNATPRHVKYARLAWFEHPGDLTQSPWKMHVIDQVRSPHSPAVSDLDGDGQLEIVCGEHDPFYPYRSRCRVYVYKRQIPGGERGPATSLMVGSAAMWERDWWSLSRDALALSAIVG